MPWCISTKIKVLCKIITEYNRSNKIYERHFQLNASSYRQNYFKDKRFCYALALWLLQKECSNSIVYNNFVHSDKKTFFVVWLLLVRVEIVIIKYILLFQTKGKHNTMYIVRGYLILILKSLARLQSHLS